MRKKLTLIIILIIFASLALNTLAQGRELEIKYPEVQGEKPEETTAQVPDYVKYIFNFAIWISGIIALGAIIYGGFKWFTSAGNLERVKDAKDQITAAILGLLIIFGSYLILTTINPELVVFNLPRLRPIISTLPPGVLVCKEWVDVGGAWALQNNFKHAKEYWEQKQIKEELDAILDDIALKCYLVVTKEESIRSDFDNIITHIYFIPGEQIINESRYIAMYGAILYEDKNYEGKSQPIYEHLKPGTLGGVVTPVPIPVGQGLKPSSIKPFVLIPYHVSEYQYQVTLFQQYNRNYENKNMVAKLYGLDPGNWYCKWDLVAGGALCAPGGAYPSPGRSFCSLPEAICGSGYISPRSIQVGGDFLAILLTPDGRSDTFYNVIDNNLDDNYNIVNWVDCEDYKSDRPTTQGLIWKQCAQPAVKDLIIISAHIL